MSDSSDAEDQKVQDSGDENQMSPASGGNPSIPVSEQPSYMPIETKGESQQPRRRGRCNRLPVIGACMYKPAFPTLGREDVKHPDFGRMIAAEVLGTALLVFFGCGSIITTSTVQEPKANVSLYSSKDTVSHEHKEFYVLIQVAKPLHVAFAFGMVVATLAQALGHISGAHLNPAVSVGLMMAGKCSLLKTLCYTVAQCIGSLIGTGMLYLSTKHLHVTLESTLEPDETAPKINWTLPVAKQYHLHYYAEEYPLWSLGTTTLAPGVDPLSGFCAEFLLTFLLVFTVVSVCDDLRKDIKGSAPLAIGIAVFVTHATGIRFTGASVNPARSFGPAIFKLGKPIKQIWLYLLAPILGGMEAGCIYAVFFAERKSDSKENNAQSLVSVKARGTKSAA